VKGSSYQPTTDNRTRSFRSAQWFLEPLGRTVSKSCLLSAVAIVRPFSRCARSYSDRSSRHHLPQEARSEAYAVITGYPEVEVITIPSFGLLLLTGTEVNVMAAKAVKRLGISSKITKSHIGLGEIGGNGVGLHQKVSISFGMGRKSYFCEEVDFLVPKEKQDTDTGRLQDVLIGLPELRKHDMIAIDPDFANEPEEGLEHLAKRADDGVSKSCRRPSSYGKMYPQVVRR
jgi:hypothetical protein